MDVHAQSASDHEQLVYATDIYEKIRIILIKIQETSYWERVYERGQKMPYHLHDAGRCFSYGHYHRKLRNGEEHDKMTSLFKRCRQSFLLPL